MRRPHVTPIHGRSATGASASACVTLRAGLHWIVFRRIICQPVPDLGDNAGAGDTVEFVVFQFANFVGHGRGPFFCCVPRDHSLGSGETIAERSYARCSLGNKPAGRRKSN